MGMKASDIIKHVDHKNMSKADKAALKKKYLEHKKNLKEAIKAVDAGIKALGKS
jgi:hypothetical protein